MSDHHGRGVTLTGELALDGDGNFLALRIGWLVNLGAYCSNAGPFINTAAAPTSMAVNAYRTPAFYGLNRLVFTNTTPGTAYRGAGRPSVSYLVERLVDEAARADRHRPHRAAAAQSARQGRLSLQDPDRLDLRQRRSAGPARSRRWRHADWNGFERRRAEAKARGRLRGIGCAIFIEPSGGVGQEEIAIRFDAEGGVRALTPCRSVRAGPRDRVSRSGRRHSRHGGGQRHAALQRSGRAGRWPAPAASARARSSATAARWRSAPTR